MAALAAATYAGTLGHQLVWDDLQIVEKLRESVKLEGFGAVVESKFMIRSANDYYRPIPLLSFWIDMRLAELWPPVFHATNVALHALNSVLVWLFCLCVLGTTRGALIGGSLFAVHPVHSESVAFVSARTDLWATAFVLLSAIAWCRVQQGAAVRPRLSRIWSGVAFLLACLSKEAAYLLPAALVFFDPPRTGNGEDSIPSRWHRAKAWIPVWALVLATALVLRFAVLERPVPAQGAGLHHIEVPGAWLLFLHYFRLLVWPWPLNAYYSSSQVALTWIEVASGVVLAGLFLLSSEGRRLQPALPAFVWLVSFLLPVSGFFYLGAVVAERFLYLPSVGFCLAVGYVLDRRVCRRCSRRSQVFFGLVLLGVLSTLSFSRSMIWKDEITLFEDIVRKSPNVAIIHNNLANAYSYVGRYDAAVAEFKKAIELLPDYSEAYFNMGTTYLAMRRYDAAIQVLGEALAWNPRLVAAYNNLAVALQKAGRAQESISVLQRGILESPGDPFLHYNLGRAYLRVGDLRSARNELEILRKIDADAASSLARLLDERRSVPQDH